MTIQEKLIESFNINNMRTAIEYSGNRISYSELFFRSNKITRFLLKQRLDKETIVGVCLQDKTDLIAAIIGIINARCIFVLLDNTLPENRLAELIRDLNLQQIIISKDSSRVASVLEKTISKHSIERILEENDVDAIQYPEFDPGDSLYIYFTSGSTGMPKGIVGKNSSLLQFAQWEIETFNVDSSTRFSQFISPYFDAFLRDVFVPLLAGGTVCIPPDDSDFFSPEKLVPWIDQSAISLIHCVPSLFRIFNSDSLTSSHFNGLKYVLLSGERIIPSELANWYELFGPRIQLVNLYGATETTMIRSFYMISSEDVKKARIPIGSPIHDTELLISNKDFKPCSTLVPGDLYIISDYVTKGYLNNPELTHQKFLKINEGKANEKIAFKTGDKARILADGKIDLLGREDRQVKLRGIRIELDEIESIIIRSKWVKNSIVIKHTEENGDESLLAFFIRDKTQVNGVQLENVISHYLWDHLPSYMIPSRLVEVSEFPLLSNGKVNYKELLNHSKTNVVVEPVNETETKLLAIWKEILGDKLISVEESFHSIGGNSISIMNLIGRIYKEFFVRISLSDLFTNLTIRKQAQFIKDCKKEEGFIISEAKKKTFYNVSSAQERVYYNYELNKERLSYNLPMAWEINGEIDKNKIQQVFNTLIERHESLRTAFSVEDGQVVQWVRDTLDLELEEMSADDEDIHHAIREFIKTFDLSIAPLFRYGLIHSTQGKKFLVVDFHHIICDGMSQMTLLSDFSSLYYGESLKPLNIQYKDYAEWEYNFKVSQDYITHREFWLDSFEGKIPKLNLPITNPAKNDITDKGGNITFKVSKKILAPFLEYLHTEEITTFSGLFSIYFMFLSQLTGDEDIVIGVASSGRMQQELEGVVGMFVKTLPIRYRMDPEMVCKDVVLDLHKYFIQAHSKQIYDLSDIIVELNNNRSTPVRTLFDVEFVFLNFNENIKSIRNNEFSAYAFENTNSKSPLILYVSEMDDSFNFRMEYSQAYFYEADIESFIMQFKTIAEKVSQNLNSRIIQILGECDQSVVLTEEDITFNF